MSDSSPVPKVTVVIPNWNTQRWLSGCLDGLRGQTYQDFEVTLVDSGSSDNSVPFINEHYPEVKVVRLPENRGFAGAVNAGIKEASSEYIALLNVDTVPQPNWLASLVNKIQQSPPEVGSLASKMLSMQNPDLIDDAGDILSWYGTARKRGMGESVQIYSQGVEVFSACAGAALYRRAFFEDVGLFDEGFTSYLEDIDLGLRGHLLGYRRIVVVATRDPLLDLLQGNALLGASGQFREGHAFSGKAHLVGAHAAIRFVRAFAVGLPIRGLGSIRPVRPDQVRANLVYRHGVLPPATDESRQRARGSLAPRS